MASVEQRWRRGVVASILAMAANQGSTLLVTWILGRALGATLTGHFVAALATAQALATFLLFGGGITATKWIAEWRLSRPDWATTCADQLTRRNGRILAIWALLTPLVLGLLFPVLDRTTWLVLMLALPLGFALQTWLFSSAVLAGYERFDRIAHSAGLGAIGWIVAACFAAATDHLWVASTLLVLGSGLQALAALVWAQKEVRKTPSETSWEAIRPQVHSFLMPAFLTSFLAPVAIWLSQGWTYRSAEGETQLALFGVAFLLRQIVMALPQNIFSASLSILNQLRGAGDQLGFYRLLRSSLTRSLLIVLAFGGMLAAFAAPVMSLWGPEFAQGAPILQVLLVAAVLEVLAQSLYQVVHAQARMWHSLTLVSLPWSLTLLGLAIAWIPRWGALGTAWAYVGAWFVSFIMSGWLARRFALESS